MRPPQKTGENVRRNYSLGCHSPASMRPPQKTGENDPTPKDYDSEAPASMRPPQKTGENWLGRVFCGCRAPGFNEAPAEDGGKPAARRALPN